MRKNVFLFLFISSCCYGLSAQSFVDGPITTPADKPDPVQYDQPNAEGYVPINAKANELVSLGKTFLERQDFSQAARAFESAIQLEFNQATTAAIFLSGQAYYFLGDNYMASQRFDQIILNYSGSRYIDDAIYHKALCLLRDFNVEKQRLGLDDLFFLISRSPRFDIVNDAREALKEHLFYKLPNYVVEDYYAKAPYSFRPLFIEAICYRRVQEGNEADARRIYNNYVLNGGRESYFLLGLFNEREVFHYYEPNVTKLALFMPLYLNNAQSTTEEIPNQSKIALDFYEGFQKAVSDFEPYSRKKLFLKVYDTQRDSQRIANQLNELDAFYPDMIIGEVYNKQSLQLSDWCERRGIPQMVPFSPTVPMRDKNYLFLHHSSVETHAHRMAEYARYKLRLNRVAVWTDGRRVTDQLIRTFSSAFDTLGGEVVLVPIDSQFTNAKKQILDYVRNLKDQQIDGFYVPISNEESCGLIISEMQYVGIPARVMGGPAWGAYSAIDKELLSRYQVVYTTSYIPKSDSLQYQSFYNEYLRIYQAPPSQYAIQGYDMGMYLLQLLNRYDYKSGQSLADYIRQYGIHRGIHQDVYFSNHHDNQLLHIMQYVPGGKTKVNRF